MSVEERKEISTKATNWSAANYGTASTIIGNIAKDKDFDGFYKVYR